MSELNNIVSLFYFAPELILCFGIVFLLIVAVFEKLKNYSFIISLIIVFLSSLDLITVFTIDKLVLKFFAVSTIALVSFGKQEPPYAGPARKNLSPIR